jgi:hypothetical protein
MICAANNGDMLSKGELCASSSAIGHGEGGAVHSGQ